MADAILVTGATGFIGGYLVAALQEAGYLTFTHSTKQGNIASCPLDFKGVRHVFHLAAKTGAPESWQAPPDYYEVNVLGTVNALEFCKRERASITYVSSYVYGKPQRLPIPEDHPLQSFNPYSHSKIVAEDVVRFYNSHLDIQTTIVRPFNVYGPGQAPRFLLPTLLRQILDPECQQITVADNRPRRDYIHVNDLVSLLLATISGTPSTVYNAGSGVSTGVEELVNIISESISLPVKPIRSLGQTRSDEILDTVADVSQAWRDLNWKPRIALDVGLREWADLIRAGAQI